MAWTRKHRDRHGGVRWTGIYRDDRGRQRSAGTAPTKRVALELAREQEARLSRGDWISPEAAAVTFAAYFEREWLPNRNLELKTRQGYASHFRHSLGPEFGDVPLRAITPSKVQGWIARQERAGVSAVSIRDRFMLLQTVLAGRRGASAIRDGYLRSNPCAGVTRPPVPTRKVTVYSPGQVDEALAQLDPWWYPLVAFLAETGCRWGEAQGLHVEDLGGHEVWISRVVVQVTKETTGTDSRFVEKAYPKSLSPRRLALSPELAGGVAELIASRRLGAGDRLFARYRGRYRNRGKVLRTAQWRGGVPVSHDHFRDVWHRACAAAGVPELRLHDLRASNISWLLAGGADLATVMQRVGHTQLSTTQRYVAALADADARALSALRAVRQPRLPRGEQES